ILLYITLVDYITRLKSLRSLYPNFQQILLLPRNQMPLRKRKFDEVSQDRTFANFVKSLHTDDIPEDEFETYLTTKITHPPELELQVLVLGLNVNSVKDDELLLGVVLDCIGIPYKDV